MEKNFFRKLADQHFNPHADPHAKTPNSAFKSQAAVSHLLFKLPQKKHIRNDLFFCNLVIKKTYLFFLDFFFQCCISRHLHLLEIFLFRLDSTCISIVIYLSSLHHSNVHLMCSFEHSWNYLCKKQSFSIRKCFTFFIAFRY